MSVFAGVPAMTRAMELAHEVCDENEKEDGMTRLLHFTSSRSA